MTNREFFLHMATSEFPRFVGVLQAAPVAGLGYRPHERSRTARELIEHLIGHEQDLLELAETGSINHRIQVPFNGIDDAIRIYREAHESARATLARVDDRGWEAMGKFLVQGNVIMEAPRRDLAWMLMDAVHHRGQLSTYLRPSAGATSRLA
jgi:uncharacterized damage-inducible protein DinB